MTSPLSTVKRHLSSLLDEEEQEAHGGSDGVTMDQRGTTTDQRKRKTMKHSSRPDVQDFGIGARPKEEKKSGLGMLSNLLRRNQKNTDKPKKPKINMKTKSKDNLSTSEKTYNLYLTREASNDSKLLTENESASEVLYENPDGYLDMSALTGNECYQETLSISSGPGLAENSHYSDSTFDEENIGTSDNIYDDLPRSRVPSYISCTKSDNDIMTTTMWNAEDGYENATDHFSSLTSSGHIVGDVHQKHIDYKPPNASELLPHNNSYYGTKENIPRNDKLQHDDDDDDYGSRTTSHRVHFGSTPHIQHVSDSDAHEVQDRAHTLPLLNQGRLLLPHERPPERLNELVHIGLKMTR